MSSDETHELRVQFTGSSLLSAFEVKEAVKSWLATRGEESYVDGEVEGDRETDLDEVCLPILLYSFDKNAIHVLRRDIEEAFAGTVRCEERVFSNASWQHDWERSFEPILTKRFIVAPPWSREDEAGERTRLRIVPGIAFGDAQHETTRLCLEVLEEIAPPKGHQGRLLDVGTGTGILAIAAKKLGWAEVSATDISTDALLASQENAVLNGAGVEWILGSFPPDDRRFDVVVANIFGHVLRGMAVELVNRLESGGWLVLSGIIEEEKDEMLKCFQVLGLHEVGCRMHNGWMAMVLHK